MKADENQDHFPQRVRWNAKRVDYAKKIHIGKKTEQNSLGNVSEVSKKDAY